MAWRWRCSGVAARRRRFVLRIGWVVSAHGGLAAGWVQSAVALPRTILLLFGGAVGGWLGARQVMIIGDAVMLVVAVTLAVVSGATGAPLTILVIAALIVGTNDAFYLPSSGSMPRRLVEPELLPRAVALRQSGTQVISLVGAPIRWCLGGIRRALRSGMGRRDHLRCGAGRSGYGASAVRPAVARAAQAHPARGVGRDPGRGQDLRTGTRPVARRGCGGIRTSFCFSADPAAGARARMGLDRRGICGRSPEHGHDRRNADHQSPRDLRPPRRCCRARAGSSRSGRTGGRPRASTVNGNRGRGRNRRGERHVRQPSQPAAPQRRS